MHSFNGRDAARIWIVDEVADNRPATVGHPVVTPAKSLPARASPSGLITTRSVMPSKFRLESSPIRAVANCGELAVRVLEKTRIPSKFSRTYSDECQSHRPWQTLPSVNRWVRSRTDRPGSVPLF